MTRLFVCSVSLLFASIGSLAPDNIRIALDAERGCAFLVDRYGNAQLLSMAALTRIRALQRAGSAADAAGLASSLSAAGCRRFLSRSCMNSSYFAVPGLGGASAGMPPAHCGMASLIPAASFSLMDPHP